MWLILLDENNDRTSSTPFNTHSRNSSLSFSFLFRFLFNLKCVIYWGTVDTFYLLEAKKKRVYTHIVIVSWRRRRYSFSYRVSCILQKILFFFFHSLFAREIRCTYLSPNGRSYRGAKIPIRKNCLTKIFTEPVVWVRIRRCTLDTAFLFFFIEHRCVSSIVSFFFVSVCVTCCVSQLACVVIWIVFSRRISS